MLPCSSIYEISNNITYNENNSDFGYTSIGTYSDGTILIQILFINNNNYNFRLIHPNGAITFINNVIIPCDSCPNIIVDDNQYPCYSCTIAVYLLNPNYILIAYQQNQNTGYMGMIMNWAGIVTANNLVLGGVTDIIKVIRNDNGGKFLVVRYNYMMLSQLSSTEYYFNNDGQINGMINGNLVFNDVDGTGVIEINNQIDLFSLGDSWAIVLMSMDSSVFFSIVQAESNQVLSVFKTLKLTSVAAYQDTVCIADEKINNQYYCLFRNFDNKLKLINIASLIPNSIDLFPFIDYYNKIYLMPKVGFLVEIGADLQSNNIQSNLQTKYFILNYEIDYSDVINGAFGEFITENYYANDTIYLFDRTFILPNNTFIQMIKNDDSLTFVARDLSPIVPKNNPYNNTHIGQVYPSQNDPIPIGVNNLKISFVHFIDPTYAVNVSIYQQLDDENLLRQRFLCTIPNCVISDDFYSLTINILNVTFNIPNASYYVEIDDNFVKYKYEYGDLVIPGIKPGNWIIKTTADYIGKDNTKTITGRLRLNQEGTNEFNNLKDINKQNEFFTNMSISLSESIPVDQSRIRKTKNIFEFDRISNSELLLVMFRIDPSNKNDFNKKNSKDVFDDLNSLVKADKDITTFLDTNDYTKNIDKDYGFQKTTDLHKEGDNRIVFKVALIIVDAAIDITFVIVVKDDLHKLFIPSIVFLTVPFILNTLFTFYIFFYETSKHPKMKKWFNDNVKLIAIIAVFSLEDVKLLHIFDSKFGKFNFCSIKFSKLSVDIITWGGFLIIFLEDLPQLIIQILYAMNFTTSYKIIAFFAFITNIVVLLVSVVEYSYHISDIIKKRFGNKEDKSGNEVELDVI
ncbi:hypothetical protein GLOIN_2v1871822 [Rhizophagus clarus]|uniref:Uncharacterized protein n=1 Tax=Rhizophagus clarus TaxID=94130 RepID=A0A8H3LWY9_9GLOM|nr:hypothetical protein GLOIN_2v1871822 [Rhizophagus clarus]